MDVRSRVVLCSMLCLIVIGLGGCSAGPTTYPVQGKVTLKKDGSPLAKGRVVFEAVGATSGGGSAELKPDGSFAGTVGKYGKFKVFFTGTDAAEYKVDPSTKQHAPAGPVKKVIPDKYTQATSTDLEVSIDAQNATSLAIQVEGT